ncbi:MAG: CoA pyrophosphatase [Planctomycetota bacterium]
MDFESADLSNLPEQLRRYWSDSSSRDESQALSESKRHLVPTDHPHREFAPSYSYGRHRGPGPRFAHSASVLVTLLPAARGNWDIPLTLRPSQLTDHGGQVSLPGGRSEGDESVWRTACREFGEELGCTTEYLQHLGELTPLYVYASRHRVTPVVAVSSLRPSIQPNPEEVAELILLPIRDLLADTIKTIGTMRRGSVEFETHGFTISGHFVWGATAMILGEFRTIVRKLVEENSFEPWLMG